jgi:UDP-3-O-[3-hydroxymyristoyl] N-acetylglucosamine deacetylase
MTNSVTKTLARTIAKPIEISDVGIHSGQKITMKLMPATENTGIVFRKKNNIEIAALYSNVTSTTMNTSITSSCGKHHIGTIEHLMSALYACQISDLLIEIDGDEVPVMDGSAIEFYNLIKPEVVLLGGTIKTIKILKRVFVEENNASAEFLPDDHFSVHMEIDFPHEAIGNQKLYFDELEHDFGKEIAAARTFGFLKEFEYLQAKGLAKGGSLKNAIVLDDKKILNQEGLRFANEFVRHKILDAVGDLFLAGHPIKAKFNGKKSFNSSVASIYSCVVLSSGI